MTSSDPDLREDTAGDERPTPAPMGAINEAIAMLDHMGYHQLGCAVKNLNTAVEGEEYLHGCTKADLAEAEAERDRYRQALEEINNADSADGEPTYAGETARKALGLPAWPDGEASEC